MSELTALPILYGQLSPMPILFGELSDVVTYHTYDGEYRVTPLIDYEVELKTENKVLKEDVVVKRIPYYEVPNPSGGTTIYLGEV